MRVNKYLLLGLFFLLVLPVVNAAPPITDIDTLERGVDIIHPETPVLKSTEDLEFNFWTYNSSTGETLNNETLNCTLYLIDDSGTNFWRFSNNAGASGLITYGKGGTLCSNCWTMTLPAANISNCVYSYQIKCQGDGIGGYTLGFFEANINGKVIEEKDSIVYMGVMFFVFILSLVFMISGGTILKGNDHIKWGGIMLISLGAVLLYGATFLANNYITMMVGSMGGESLMSGFFLFFARMLKYSPYLVIGMVIYFVLKWRKSISDATPDGWDNNLY